MTTRSTLVHASTFDLSYSTMIRQVLPGGLTIGNVTRYSVTTSKHQTICGVRSCDVLLDDVPQGCSDLLALAMERKLIEVSYVYNHDEYGMTTPMVRRAIPSVA